MADITPPLLTDLDAIERFAPVRHRSRHAEIVFGAGAIAELARAADELGAIRTIILCTPDRRVDGERAAAELGPRTLAIVAAAVMHSPVGVSNSVAADAVTRNADLLVSIGGGSSIGLGKAVALRTGLPHIAIPTTYAGSEMTPILGETADGVKTTIRRDDLRPRVVFYDPDLNATLPVSIATASGINALAHAVEALYMTDDEALREVATAAIGHLVAALPEIVATPTAARPRMRALYGAWLAGHCLAESPMALHHKLCHAIGGAFDLPHAETHAVILPHALAFNAPAIPVAYATLMRLLAGEPAAALFRLVAALGLPVSLTALGMPRDGIATVARLAVANAYDNPRRFDEALLTCLLSDAWAGTMPKVKIDA